MVACCGNIFELIDGRTFWSTGGAKPLYITFINLLVAFDVPTHQDIFVIHDTVKIERNSQYFNPMCINNLLGKVI